MRDYLVRVAAFYARLFALIIGVGLVSAVAISGLGMFVQVCPESSPVCSGVECY